MMTRRILGLAAVLLLAGIVFTGCDLLNNEVRSSSPATPYEDDDRESKAGAVESKPAKGFFKASRLPGALSNEGRDIERSLGIP
ncbi:hypothetical protein [Singulisphaera sp. PoT]|uniref:hypothetical protein n=1 Tax=Singulisphaera sp. PoT TaxID=3411797 RepID=UPI003BF554A5